MFTPTYKSPVLLVSPVVNFLIYILRVPCVAAREMY